MREGKPSDEVLGILPRPDKEHLVPVVWSWRQPLRKGNPHALVVIQAATSFVAQDFSGVLLF